MSETDVATIKRNSEIVLERIADAAARVGRKPGQVRLMAVTKTRPESIVRAALEAGVTLFGENRVQEALSKYAELKDSLELHLIGHLQRNKAKPAARLFDWVESIDKGETAMILDKWAGTQARTVNVLIEVNTSGEDSKFGVRDENSLWGLIPEVLACGNLRLRGLMTVGPFTSETARIRRAFADLRRLFEQARARFPETALDTLSMGMSADYAIAVEEGSTEVRIGTAILGPREAS